VPSKKIVDELLTQLLAGDRRALARAITLVESQAKSDCVVAGQLLTAVMPYCGKSMRIGISGPPGVGKSSFIEAIGKKLLENSAHKVAVLAIDPSSRISGGSILGDKTRMEDLSRHDRAFVRPSPCGDASGGVARHTRESIFLAEAAGHDVVIVETIGVGQSESAVASMVDFFVLLHQPSSGDDLQGIKRGNLELADFVVVSKADGDLLPAARKAQSELMHALSYFSTQGQPAPEVLACSSLTGDGIDKVVATIESAFARDTVSGRIESRRKKQTLDWFHDEVRERTLGILRHHERTARLIALTETDVASGKLAASTAAARVVAKIMS